MNTLKYDASGACTSNKGENIANCFNSPHGTNQADSGNLLFMSHPLIVILNPASGKSDDDYRSEVEAAFQKSGAAFEIRETSPHCQGDKLARQALEEGAREIVACGGDGTVMAVVNGIARAQLSVETGTDENNRCTLSIVPGGTANLVAAALGIPTEFGRAVALATGHNARVRTIDLGQCEQLYFVLGVGVGLTERLVSRTSSRDKETLGKLAYVKAMLSDLGARPHSIKFKLDDRNSKRARGVAVVIANARTIGTHLDFAPDAKMDDGQLDLCILHSFGLRDLVRIVWHSLRGQLPKDRGISFYQARRIEITTDPPLDVQVDGELEKLPLPLIAQVVTGALQVRVPDQENYVS